MSKSSQDSLVARPYDLDAEGFLSDLEAIVQIGGVGGPIKRLTTFKGDFVASVIQINDLSEETPKGQLQVRPLPCRTTN